MVVVVKNMYMVGNDHAASDPNTAHRTDHRSFIDTGMVTDPDFSRTLGLQQTINPAMITDDDLAFFLSGTIRPGTDIQIFSRLA